MNKFLEFIRGRKKAATLRSILALAAAGGLGASFAAQTDISNSPLTSVSSAQIKPNVMLLMDTSGSMGWGHMPDEVEDAGGLLKSANGIGTIGYKSAQCNVLYYNPKLTYEIPKKPDLSLFPTPSFASAPYAGFVAYYVSPDNSDALNTSTVNLSTSFKAYDDRTLRKSGYNDTPQQAYYYVHSGGVAMPYGSAPCIQSDTNGPGSAGSFAADGGGTWTRVLVSSTAEQANFAIWYSYYRTRIGLIKSAASLAFTPLSDNFRVGLITVNPKDLGLPSASATVKASKYVPIADFNTAQRSSWFSNLFSQIPGGSSPAREGLARVGRHYAGKQDGINAGMTGDPVQYSCQQNFTIMTTDGYWNAQNESPGGGPVQIDGTTLVADIVAGRNPDSPLSPLGNAPRPIYDGSSDSTEIITDKNNFFSYANCGTFYNVSTNQISSSTSQLTASTSQLQQSTSQINVNTSITTQSTTQKLKTTSQLQQSTAQLNQSTSQLSKSTSQLNRSTTQLQQGSTQLTRSTSQLNIVTAIIRKSTSQLTQSTSQLAQTTLQTRIATSQINKSTSQLTRSTSQLQQSSSQLNISTSQTKQSTSQVTATLTNVTQSTSQTVKCDASTELCAPVAPGTCTTAGLITCQINTTGPTLVASCAPSSATAANNYVTTTCSTAVTGPTGVASCVPASANSLNGYTTTACTPVTTGPAAVATCTPATASSSNGYTTTTCVTTVTGPTGTGACTAAAPTAANSYVTTTCPIVTTGPTGVQTCAAQTANSGNSYLAITCNTATTGPTGVATCSASPAGSGNSWLATTCNTATTGPTPVSSCTAVAASSGNSYLATTCNTVTSGPTAVATCTASAASSTNSYTTTTCPNVTTGPTGVASCTPDTTPTSANSYTTRSCATFVTGPTGVASCTADTTPTSANLYTTRSCSTLTTGPTAVAACTTATAGSGNSYVATTCATTTTGPTPTGSCTVSTPTAGNGYTSTTCPVVTTGPTNVGTCTAAVATAANSWTTTTCATVNGTATGVATCTPSTPNGGGAGVACTTVTTGPTPVATCTASGPTAANLYTTTTCNTVTSGPTLVATCTPATAGAGNTYTATTCANATTGPTPVASCAPATAVAGNNFVTTTCNTVNSGPTGVSVCTAGKASATNNYTTTTCSTATVGPIAVSSCTPIPASSANSYLATTCADNNNGPTPVASCTASLPSSGNSYTTTTCNTTTTGPTPAGSCTESDADAGNGYTTTTCPAPVTTAGVGVGSCTPVKAASGNNWTATLCDTVATGPTGVSACTQAAAASGNNYTATTCSPVVTGPTRVASCVPATASSSNDWTTTTCNAVATGPILSATCTASAANAGNNYVATTCAPLPGQKIQYVTTTTTTTTELSGSTAVTAPVTTTKSVGPTDLEAVGVCYAPGTQPSLPTPNPQKAGLAAGLAPTAADGVCTASSWPCTLNPKNNKGSFNSLADVAQYYYVTDLRPSMPDNLLPPGTKPEGDWATWQHMTTFTIALGVSGTLNYQSDYRKATTGDFARLRTGAINWPVWPDVSLDYSTGEAWNNPKSIDDYWHTAVNGRGQYFSAGNPTSVIAGLSGALADIGQQTAAGSSAGASSLQPTTGDNFAFVASYTTKKWTGDIQAKPIDLVTGVIGTFVTDSFGKITENPPIWSAQVRVKAATSDSCDNRQIYLMRQGATDNKVNFSWNTQACDSSGLPTGPLDNGLSTSERLNFTGTNITLLGHYPSMTDGTSGTVDQRTAASGANLVNFLRGQRGNEGFVSNSATKLYREREFALGDIVGSQPVYVKGPFANYADSGYQAFKAANAGRTPMVYAGGNDGMLHAFYAGTSLTDPDGGKEAWAMIPSSVLPNLYKLADNNYGSSHRFFVDGTPTVGDVFDTSTSTWKTVLVGGLNAGGKAYYAVDVTNPTAPKAMWEFKWSSTCYDGTSATAGSDCHLGLTFGKPVISKLANGTWVVMFTSGYNNVSAPPVGGDGIGYLYVLDAITGKIVQKISTSVGDSSTPSGLGQINNFVDNGAINNTTVRVYGGDMLGNIWRFDVNDNLAPSGIEASLVGVTKATDGTAQPITVRPELAELNGKPMVFVATGRLLGAADVTDTQSQSIYGIVDPLSGNPAYADLRSVLRPLVMTTSADGTYRTVSCTGTLCGSTDGWVVNLPESKERVNVEMELVLGTLIVGSNIPGDSACEFGGRAWINYLNFSDGSAISTSPNGSVSASVAGGLIVGTKTVQLPGGKFETEVRTSDTKTKALPPPIATAVPRGNRISWREIAQ
jgi:Tfp pilus tip-associated adhesin PilY1